MFTLKQTKKSVRSKPEMSSVPNGWLIKGKLYWPPANQTKLMADPTSKADPKSWKEMKNFRIIDKSLTTAAAENRMEKLSQVTDSDDALLKGMGTRQTPGKKKQQFTPNSYTLQPPTSGPVSLYFLCFGSANLNWNEYVIVVAFYRMFRVF